MQIDNSAGLQPVYSCFDGFVRGGHFWQKRTYLVSGRDTWRGSVTQFEHAQNRRFGALAHWFGQSDLRFHVQESVVRFFERVHLHEPALAAKAIIRGAGNERFARDFFMQAMQQTGFSNDNDLACWRFPAERYHLFGGTNFIGQHAHGVGAFRMRHDRCIRILLANAVNAPRSELDVHVTSALPQIHFASRPFHHPRAEILVRNKENVSISGSCADNLVGIATRADHVGQSLSLPRCN